MPNFVFPPDSLIWRISRENVILLGGPAAAILQIAHPEIAAGVAAHSNFRTDSIGRLHRTLGAIYTITFATQSEADALARRVAAIHKPVEGTAPVRYSAASPDAQLWVLATLIALGVEIYELLVAPLTPEEHEAHYREMRHFGRYFGLDPGFGPQDAAAFREYYAGMLRNDLLGSIPLCREVADAVARPRQPWWLAAAAGPLAGLVAETIPPPVRERLGFASTPSSRLGHAASAALLRRLIPHLPDHLRFTPRYLAARQSLGID